jgi:uncharacterized protein with HEPN domain
MIILGSIQQIEAYLDNVNEKEFYEDFQKQDAVLRRLEIIGEAVKQIPDDIRKRVSRCPLAKSLACVMLLFINILELL